MTRTYAVVGDPISHSLSPAMHNAAFRELGMDCTYIAYRIPQDELEEGIDSLRHTGIAGFNVTIPHKIGVIKYLDSVDRDSELIGAVNTVSIDGGAMRGHNTDMQGFMEPLQSRGVDLENTGILLVGAGGAARAIVAGLAGAGARNVVIANRDYIRAKNLAEFSKKLDLGARAIPLQDAGREAAESGIIINATRLGLGGEPFPVPAESLSKESVVYDIVYMPVRTDLVTKAKSRGATVIYGHEMLLGQAAAAFGIWHKRDAPREAMKKAILGGF